MKVYGVTEIARALGVDPVLVAKWRERGKLPLADVELSVGPVWLAGTIEPFLERGGPDRKPGGRRMGVYEVRARVRLGRFPGVDAAARARFDGVMQGGENRRLVQPAVAWEEPMLAVVTMGCTASDEAEAFGSVRSMIMKRAGNVALLAVDEVESVGVTRLGDW